MTRFLIAGVIVAAGLAVLAGCAGAPGASLSSPETAQAEPLRIAGALTYRERIALPPQSRAQIELREGAAGEGAVVAAASGAKYEASGDPSTTLWNKGASSRFVVRGKAYPECSPAAAKVSSVRGNEPAWLLRSAWVVEEIDSSGIIEGLRATLNFSAEERLSGKASCNSHTGKYVLSGEGLRIGPTVATTMACEPRLMQQEQAFLARLEAIRRFELAADSALLLINEDQRSIRASRV